jgi:aryl-alcohol dehydrogenase-like predicted oxidoreductase
MERRDFLKQATAAAAAIGCFPASLAGIERTRTDGPIERRSLGRTGERLSIIGFGGIVVMNATPEESATRVAEAIDRSINYFDVAPSYGNAEERLGPALQPYREKVFLACKTQKRTRAEALAELETSLRLMRTDRFDLYQLHAVSKLDEVEQIFAPGGAMEALEAARKAGKTRFLGFSAHSEAAAIALMQRYRFDTILYPVNYATWHAGNFGPQVLATAQQQQMGILALKAMARGPWAEGADRKAYPKCWYEPLAERSAALEGLRFTLAHPITSAIPPGDERLFRMALDLAANITPLTPAEAEAIKRKGTTTTPLFRAATA